MLFADQYRVCVELTDYELRWFWYSFRGRDKSLNPIRFEITPVPQGIIKQSKILHPEAFLPILEGYLEKSKLELKLPHKPPISIGLPLQNQFIREYNMPWIKKGNRAGFLYYLAEEEIPIPKEELIYDYLILEEKGTPKRLKVTLSGIRESILSPVVMCFKKAGFEIEKVCFAQVAWGKALDFGMEENTLLLREEEGHIQYIFYKGPLPEIMRNLPAAVQHYGEEEWNDEIRRMLFYLSTLHEEMNLKKILWGEGNRIERLGKRIGEYLQGVGGKVPVLQGVEEVVPSCKEEKYLGVWGMALEDKMSLNNFWRTENLKKTHERLKWLAAFLILLTSLGGWEILQSSAQNLGTLRLQAEQLREVKEIQALAEEQDVVQRMAWEKVAGKTTAVGQAVKELTAYAPKGIYFERIEIKERRIAVEGIATESLGVQKVFNQLKEQGWGNVQLAKYQITEDYAKEKMLIEFILRADQYD